MAYAVGDRVLTRWNGWVTIVEVLDRPDAPAAPRTQYRVDVGKGWTTVVWPDSILRTEEGQPSEKSERDPFTSGSHSRILVLVNPPRSRSQGGTHEPDPFSGNRSGDSRRRPRRDQEGVREMKTTTVICGACGATRCSECVGERVVTPRHQVRGGRWVTETIRQVCRCDHSRGKS